MAVERAPYVNYSEIASYSEDISNGSEIPLFVVKTNNVVAASSISPSSVVRFISYTKFKEYFSIPEDEDEYDELDSSIKDLDNFLKDYFIENNMYGIESTYGLTTPYIFVLDVGNKPTISHYEKALEVSEMKRRSTVTVFPNTEDINFMKAVDTKLRTEQKEGLLRVGYFRVSGQGNSPKFRKGIVVRPTFNHYGYKNLVKGYKLTHSDTTVFCKNATYVEADVIPNDTTIIYQDLSDNKYYKYENNAFAETTLEALEGYSEVVEGYFNSNKFYEEESHETQITPVESALYLDVSNNKKYTYKNNSYIEVEAVISKTEEIVYESDADYNLFKPSTMSDELGGVDESFNDYCKRLEFISREVNSSRVAIVDELLFGRTIARICSTPYYIEPGYLPYMSVPSGVFEERTKDERDSLFATGLIFGEDDYTLSTITPRMCIASSTAWGIEDHDMRVADALLHARRNVDFHVRKMLNIIAPQLKRNETSVNIRHVQNQLDLYLLDELEKGTIIAYSVEVKESSYNPYTLLIKGNIMSVNATLGIDFENTIRSPYAIASDYV